MNLTPYLLPITSPNPLPGKFEVRSKSYISSDLAPNMSPKQRPIDLHREVFVLYFSFFIISSSLALYWHFAQKVKKILTLHARCAIL